MESIPEAGGGYAGLRAEGFRGTTRSRLERRCSIRLLPVALGNGSHEGWLSMSSVPDLCSGTSAGKRAKPAIK